MIQLVADIGATFVEKLNNDVVDEQLNLSQIVVEKPKTRIITSKYSFPKAKNNKEVISKTNTKS